MGSEIKHVRRDISDIKEVIDELKAGQARLERLMEEMKWLALGTGKGSKATGLETENARNRLRRSAVAVIASERIFSLTNGSPAE